LTPESIDFISGSIAGAISIVVGQPFDTIKVRLQTNPSYKGPIDCFKTIMKNEGFGTLFSGMGPPLLTSVATNAIIFSSYGYTVRLLTNNDEDNVKAPQMFLAGSIAGLAQSFVCCPSELVKIRLQTDSHATGTMDVIKRIMRSAGLKGLYRGFGATLIREIPAFSAYFTTYYCMLNALGDTFGEILPSFMAGGMAGAVSWSIIYPADIAKSIIQMNDKSSTNAMTVLKDIHRTNGLKSLYRGLGTTIVRSLPVNAVIFPIYEMSAKVLLAFAEEDNEL
jgi:solute carrier family 25 (mitochondrial carnitine/acylcarnitine transporter), member 20/29